MFPLRKWGCGEGRGLFVCVGCIVWGTGSVGKGFYRGWGQFRGGIVVKRSAAERSDAQRSGVERLGIVSRVDQERSYRYFVEVVKP